MIEIQDDIWKYYDKGNWIVITTNGNVNSNGDAVMGKGIALEAKQRLPNLPVSLGKKLKEIGNYPHYFPMSRVITFPTKNNWREGSDMRLIERSAAYLEQLCKEDLIIPIIFPIYMTRPGCGEGGLDWSNVKPILEKYLNDRFIICDKDK